MPAERYVIAMVEPVDARCVECGATFPRSAALTGEEDRLSCPSCASSVIRGIPSQHTALVSRENTRCTDCGATFPHDEARTEVKGVLACPDCGSTSALEKIDPRDG